MRQKADVSRTRAAATGRAGTPIVRSAERVAKIMEALFLAPEGRSLTDLSRDLGLHKTTTLRLLRTLVAVEVVERDESRDRYHWKPMIWMAAAIRLRQSWGKIDAIQQLLDQLADDVGQSVGLAFPSIDGRRMILALYALANRPVRVHIAQHIVTPMHCVAAGRIYLASLPDGELREWLKADLEAITEHTLTSPDELFDEITTARRLGYAATHQQSLSGASGIAVLVRNPEGKAIAAVGLAAPLGQATDDNFQRWLPAMRRCADEISQRLHALPDQEAIAAGLRLRE